MSQTDDDYASYSGPTLGSVPRLSPENSSEGPGSKRPSRLIVFSRDRITGQSIYSVQPDGSHLRLIARGVRLPRYRPGHTRMNSRRPRLPKQIVRSRSEIVTGVLSPDACQVVP